MTRSSHDRPADVLHTATAIGDPVLLRIETPGDRLVLLADDASQDSAGLMRLHNVRCVRATRGMLSRLRRPTETRHAEVHVRRVGNRHLAEVPAVSTLAWSPRSFPLKNLSAVHFAVLMSLPADRLLTTTRALLAAHLPPRQPQTLLHRLRQAVTRRQAAAASL